MFNDFKAVVKKISELPWEDFRNLLGWPAFGSTLQDDNPHLLIAKAVDPDGDVCAYVSAEPILLVDGYVFNPNSTPSNSQKAGNVIDIALAQKAGVQRMFVRIPDGAPRMKGERLLRVFERKVSQPVADAQPIVDCSTSHTVWLN
jgi:hypothetical protein